LRFLDLSSNEIGPAGARALADCPALAGLRVLDLGLNRIGTEGARALASSPHLANLRELGVSWNNLDGEAVLALASSGCLGQLRILQVGSGRRITVPDKALRALAESPHLPNLVAVEVAGGPSHAEMADLLRAAGKGVAR
jgi:hypothetical protein